LECYTWRHHQNCHIFCEKVSTEFSLPEPYGLKVARGMGRRGQRSSALSGFSDRGSTVLHYTHQVQVEILDTFTSSI